MTKPRRNEQAGTNLDEIDFSARCIQLKPGVRLAFFGCFSLLQGGS
jgi:hypothetical protein